MILKRDYKQVQTQHAQLIFTAFSSSCLLCNSHLPDKPVTWMGSQWQEKCRWIVPPLWVSLSQLCGHHAEQSTYWRMTTEFPFTKVTIIPRLASVALWDTLEASWVCLLWMSLLVGKNILFLKMLLMWFYSNGN